MGRVRKREEGEREFLSPSCFTACASDTNLLVRRYIPSAHIKQNTLGNKKMLTAFKQRHYVARQHVARTSNMLFVDGNNKQHVAGQHVACVNAAIRRLNNRIISRMQHMALDNFLFYNLQSALS